MGRFLAFLFVFFLGGVAGTLGGALTQEQANGLMRSIATEIDIHPGDKQRIVDAMRRADQPPSPCATAIEAL